MPEMPKIESMPSTIEEIILPTQANTDGRYTCCYCDVIVKRRYDLKRHVVGTHINARPYRCVREGAGCTFSGANQKGNLTQHYNNSPDCEEARLKKEAEDAASKQISPAALVKVEDTISQQYPQFEPPVAHPALVAEEPKIPASIRASVTRPKKTLRLGTHRVTPYSTSGRRGPSASEASTSRPSRRQAQVTSDISWFNIQAAVPHPQVQLLSTYSVQQYHSLDIRNYEQPLQLQALQSDGPYNASYQSSRSVESFTQPQLIPGHELLSALYSETAQDFPQCDNPTIDPALLCFQDNIPEFKSTDTLLSTSLISDLSFEDEALQALFAATQASGGIDLLQAQFDPTLLRESGDCDGPATLPQMEPLDTAPFDTMNEYDRFHSSWITGDYSYLESTVADDLFAEPTINWTLCMDDPLKRDFTAGYAQNSFSRCASPAFV